MAEKKVTVDIDGKPVEFTLRSPVWLDSIKASGAAGIKADPMGRTPVTQEQNMLSVAHKLARCILAPPEYVGSTDKVVQLSDTAYLDLIEALQSLSGPNPWKESASKTSPEAA